MIDDNGLKNGWTLFDWAVLFIAGALLLLLAWSWSHKSSPLTDPAPFHDEIDLNPAPQPDVEPPDFAHQSAS